MRSRKASGEPSCELYHYRKAGRLDAAIADHYDFLLPDDERDESRRDLEDATMPARKPAKRLTAPDEAATRPPAATTGKISSAKAAAGDKPVFDYIASLPLPQRSIAEKVDALAARTLPGLQRSVKWGMSYYGVGDGWCFCCGDFGGLVKLMFIGGAALRPVPPVTPTGMGKATRGVEIATLDDLDEGQLADWMKQVAAVPGVGHGKRSAA